MENTPEAVATAWVAALSRGDRAAALALELPGRSPTVYDWARPEISPYVTEQPGCRENWPLRQYCWFIEADPAPGLILWSVDGRWMVSHPIVGTLDEPELMGGFCNTLTTPLEVRGGPGAEYPAFDVLPAGECVGGYDQTLPAFNSDEMWQLVDMGDGDSGWVPMQDIGFLD
ncbi:MAG: hypothetical protein CSA55_05045 [Ilumatobacter coccineus]|uniref:SH3 domain-containing protein n=1 Tax=Ilumatobacter coccineus TaxID=467094 RepID=A0A2G6K7S7_9ACTN|nr:MAG: hypothetical protein CSA55_05045 [Ilumatobacter coccineus]